MTSNSIISWFDRLKQFGQRFFWPRSSSWPTEPPSLNYWAQHQELLPPFVQQSPVGMRYLHLLGPLAWEQFPERQLSLTGNIQPVPYAPFAAACLVKSEYTSSMPQ